MPKCVNCQNKWERLETIKASFTFKPWMTCPKCGKKQYQTLNSRKKGSFYLLAVPVTLLISQLLVPVAGWWSFVLYLAVITVIFFYLYPKTVELTNKETPLW